MTALFLPKREASQKQARVIVQILGGLGNQMFQYALGRAISQRAAAPLLLDTNVIKFAPQGTQRSYGLDIFKLQPALASRADVSSTIPTVRGWRGRSLTVCSERRARRRSCTSISSSISLGFSS